MAQDRGHPDLLCTLSERTDLLGAIAQAALYHDDDRNQVTSSEDVFNEATLNHIYQVFDGSVKNDEESRH